MVEDVSKDAGVQRFWDAYVASANVVVKEFTVSRFGDSVNLADELATHVIAGKKRAATRLLRDFTALGKRLPTTGSFSVIIDGKNSPCCIVQILQVDIKSLGDVDEKFARDEGGGDGTLEWWRAAHARYFKRQAAREGFTVDDATELVLERFEVVWPFEHSDRP